MKQLKTEVAIIGAGASGLAMALYLKRANIPFLLFEKNIAGGKLNQISKITNFLGIKEIDGPSLAFNMFSHISSLNISLIEEEILKIKKDNNSFILHTNESEINANYVVIATGMIMQKLNVKGYDLFLNKGISSCAICDGYLYKNKAIAIIGNSDLADKEFNYLNGLTNTIYRIDNKNEKVLEFIGTSHLEKIITTKRDYEVSGAFIYTDESINLNLIKDLNLDIKNGRILTDEDFMSSVKNVYAIGDATYKQIYQVVGAINDASIASVALIKAIKNEGK